MLARRAFSTARKLAQAEQISSTLSSLSTQRQVQALLADHGSYVLNTYARAPFILSHGKGMYLFDTQSRQYLDFTAGVAVNALGHADPGVSKVLEEQSKELVHCCNLFHHVWGGETAKLIIEQTKRHGGLGYVAAEAEQQAADTPKDATEAAVEAVSSGLKVFFASWWDVLALAYMY